MSAGTAPLLRLDDLVVGEADDLRSVMDRMTRNRLGVALVCSAGRHLVGVVADGDLRRALVDGAVLGAPVAKVMNADPFTATDEAGALASVAAGGLVAVPVVDPTNAVLAVALAGAEPRLVRAEARARSSSPGSAVRTLALVPARGGSRRLPGKNLARLGGSSLVARAVAAGRAASGVDLIVVSTDDPAIAAEAERAGARVPWMRPPELATDDATTAAVVAHALEWARDALDPAPEVLVLLEPTAPVRPTGLIDQVLAALEAAPEAACALTVAAVPHTLHPDEQLVATVDGLVPFDGGELVARRLRGAQTPTVVPTGQVYAVRTSRAAAGEGVLVSPAVPVVRPWSEAVDIDDPEDLRRAQALWATGDPA